MASQRQEALLNTFLDTLDDDIRPLYADIAAYLAQLGYRAKKDRANISFKHGSHNKQMAKMGVRSGKIQTPFFALRFSACRDLPPRFCDIVKEAIQRYPSKTAGCLSGLCGFCGGEPASHVYSHTLEDGQSRAHCGAYALEIPGMSGADVQDIKALIYEEHGYLMRHEAAG